MGPDSDNVQPPFLGPEVPDYPVILTVCRVNDVALPGVNVYPGYASQFTPPLTLRDREVVYIWEPNGIFLAKGYYVCRLVGSYSGRPLYVTFCCQTAGSSAGA